LLLIGIVSALAAGCTPNCPDTCRKILRCDELAVVEYGQIECEESCNRASDLYESWEDQDKIDAFDAHRQCISASTCEEISAGVCYEDEIFIFQ
jgi:hypothetical protein